MYLPLILFFISLVGIVFLIGRKLRIVRNSGIGEVVDQDYAHPFVPDLLKLKNISIINIKKYGHLSLVTILRFHVKSNNFFKNEYSKMKERIKNMTVKKDQNGNKVERAQVSKFLKVVSEYKHKLREIKHKIHEEENGS